MQLRRSLTAAAAAGLLILGGVACDNEDAQDVQEGVENLQNEAEDVGNEVEEQVDENLDTDGQDDGS